MRAELAASRPRRARGLTARQQGGTVVIEDRSGRRRVSVNPTALAVWDLCDGNTSPTEMLDAMTAVFDAPTAVLDRDVESALDQLLDLGLLEGVDVR